MTLLTAAQAGRHPAPRHRLRGLGHGVVLRVHGRDGRARRLGEGVPRRRDHRHRGAGRRGDRRRRPRRHATSRASTRGEHVRDYVMPAAHLPGPVRRLGGAGGATLLERTAQKTSELREGERAYAPRRMRCASWTRWSRRRAGSAAPDVSVVTDPRVARRLVDGQYVVVGEVGQAAGARTVARIHDGHGPDVPRSDMSGAAGGALNSSSLSCVRAAAMLDWTEVSAVPRTRSRTNRERRGAPRACSTCWSFSVAERVRRRPASSLRPAASPARAPTVCSTCSRRAAS